MTEKQSLATETVDVQVPANISELQAMSFGQQLEVLPMMLTDLSDRASELSVSHPVIEEIQGIFMDFTVEGSRFNEALEIAGSLAAPTNNIAKLETKYTRILEELSGVAERRRAAICEKMTVQQISEENVVERVKGFISAVLGRKGEKAIEAAEEAIEDIATSSTEESITEAKTLLKSMKDIEEKQIGNADDSLVVSQELLETIDEMTTTLKGGIEILNEEIANMSEGVSRDELQRYRDGIGGDLIKFTTIHRIIYESAVLEQRTAHLIKTKLPARAASREAELAAALRQRNTSAAVGTLEAMEKGETRGLDALSENLAHLTQRTGRLDSQVLGINLTTLNTTLERLGGLSDIYLDARKAGLARDLEQLEKLRENITAVHANPRLVDAILTPQMKLIEEVEEARKEGKTRTVGQRGAAAERLQQLRERQQKR